MSHYQGSRETSEIIKNNSFSLKLHLNVNGFGDLKIFPGLLFFHYNEGSQPVIPNQIHAPQQLRGPPSAAPAHPHNLACLQQVNCLCRIISNSLRNWCLSAYCWINTLFTLFYTFLCGNSGSTVIKPSAETWFQCPTRLASVKASIYFSIWFIWMMLPFTFRVLPSKMIHHCAGFSGWPDSFLDVGLFQSQMQTTHKNVNVRESNKKWIFSLSNPYWRESFQLKIPLI